MRPEKIKLHLICAEKERKNELINAETDQNAAGNTLSKYKQRQSKKKAAK